MDEKRKAILHELQDGFMLETRPFKRIAKKLNCTEQEVIDEIKKCCDEGLIRRIGAAVRPQNVGKTVNAMVAWKVEESRMDEVGQGMSERKAVSHCYDRECPDGWEYNLFTMIHANDEADLEQILQELKDQFKLEDLKIYRTVKELKKTSMRYFDEEK